MTSAVRQNRHLRWATILLLNLAMLVQGLAPLGAASRSSTSLVICGPDGLTTITVATNAAGNFLPDNPDEPSPTAQMQCKLCCLQRCTVPLSAIPPVERPVLPVHWLHTIQPIALDAAPTVIGRHPLPVQPRAPPPSV